MGQDYAKLLVENVNKPKKLERFCICLTFFHYLCNMLADVCIVPRRGIKRQLSALSL